MSDAKLIACSRMYNVSAGVRVRWDDLFAWLSQEAGVALDIVAHASPAPLAELWERRDMGAVFMCGFPLSRWCEAQRPTILAAPVAEAPWAGGRPYYASHIVVTEDGPIRSAAQLGTATWGWTVRDSQSGYHAPRGLLADLLQGKLLGRSPVGPLLNPSGVVEALRCGRIEAGPIDAYAYELLAMHQPDALAGLRIVATTEPTPCPPLVSSPGVPAEMLSTLRQALLRAHECEDGRGLLRQLGLARFAHPDVADYRILAERADAVDRRLAAW
ncbi:phosphate/phosphite/phosphonate ABC transporter substrate-binding protein [Bosea sp. TAF32]|uniref:phosphate/phosphite/phosphonate ABC transporter substrate-binding protein n=1 Tax=Bosea sp. TAF32 TaxID=3237482 RepID=UPI003F90B02C